MHVLLAIDGSPQSTLAAEFCAALPFRKPPQITLVSALVDTQFDLAATEAGVQIQEVERQAAQQCYDQVKKILEPVASRVDHTIQREHPSHLIYELGKRLDVDLIVLGSVGHSALYRMTLGSTADYVANHAKCSTLIVRSAPKPQEQRAAAKTPLKILLAYDGSHGSQEALSQVKAFAWSSPENEIHLATMLERPKLIPEDEIYDAELIAKKKMQLEELSQPELWNCKVTYSVKEAVDISHAINSQAEEIGADLLVSGDTSRSLISRFFLGSTSRYLLHHAHCSILIARKKHWVASPRSS
jgi:nucleotide-binding universal stress UspA family protein